MALYSFLKVNHVLLGQRQSIEEHGQLAEGQWQLEKLDGLKQIWSIRNLMLSEDSTRLKQRQRSSRYSRRMHMTSSLLAVGRRLAGQRSPGDPQVVAQHVGDWNMVIRRPS